MFGDMASERFSSHQATGQIIIWTLWRSQLKERMEQERRKKDDCFWKLFGAGDYNISMLVSFWSFMLVFMVVSMSGPISKFPGSFHLSFHFGISVSLGLPVNCQCQLPSQISTSLYPRHFRVIWPSPRHPTTQCQAHLLSLFTNFLIGIWIPVSCSVKA